MVSSVFRYKLCFRSGFPFSSTISTGTRTLTTVQQGTAFEKRALRILQDTMSMSLKRVGGKDDGGIDLMGWWWLPAHGSSTTSTNLLARPRRIRVLAQCKAEKKNMGPKYVREMEGVSHRLLATAPGSRTISTRSTMVSSDPDITADASMAQEHIPLVALLISESPFTKSAMLRAQSSPIPFFLLHIPALLHDSTSSTVDGDGPPQSEIGSAVWNPALYSENGLLGGEMEVRWERSLFGGGRPGLWWNNKKLLSWTPGDASPEVSWLK